MLYLVALDIQMIVGCKQPLSVYNVRGTPNDATAGSKTSDSVIQ